MAEDVSENSISRRLERRDEKTGKWSMLDQADIASLNDPLVILGDPGLGKSVLTQYLGTLPGYRYIRAGSFVRHANPQVLLNGTTCLVIDGLDEVASMDVGGGIDAVLSKLSSIGYPRFIISSREVDWRGASDRIKIEDDYGRPATLVRLQPFDRYDAECFLHANFPHLDPVALLEHLAQRGLDDIYKNPLTLRLIGEVRSSSEHLPTSRAELIIRACEVMLREENFRHHDAPHAQANSNRILLSAGAHAALQILCDFSGIFTGAVSSCPDGFVHVDEVATLPLTTDAQAVLRTRLFYADGEHRFQVVHRVIAEFLGARWLVACFEAGVPERRILGLLSSGGGIPTSLRGIHAWLAHFSDTLAPRCIAADPYAVLRYGDADTMPVGQAKLLLAALRRLSTIDPQFRAGDWSRHPVAALMKLELKNDILDVIGAPLEHPHLTLLLLEAMHSSPLAAELAPELTDLVFNRQRYFAERSRAVEALRSVDAIPDWSALIERLVAKADRDSCRLAWEQLHNAGIDSVPMQLAVNTLLARGGILTADIDSDDDALDLVYVSEKSISKLNFVQIDDFIKCLRTTAEPLLEHVSRSTKSLVTDIARILSFRALKLNPNVPAATVWHWLGWLQHHDGHREDAKSDLRQWFAENHRMRRAIQAHVVFDGGHNHVRDAMFFLHCNTLSSPCDSADRVALVEIAEARAKPGSIEIGLLEELVLLDRSESGISPEMNALARRLGSQDPAFLVKLDEWTKPIVYDWQRDEGILRAKKLAERQSTYQKIRDHHAANAPDIDMGEPRLLYETAKVYLGRYYEFGRDVTPHARVVSFLGETLGEKALLGFMASLLRTDLPSAQEIAEIHVSNKEFIIEIVLICGVAERIRRGIGLADISMKAAQSTFMSWRRSVEANEIGQIEIGKTLESLVLTDETVAEWFFRTSIEPHLLAQSKHIQDLYYLANDARWSRVAGRLAIEWLERFPNLPAIVEVELLNCASRHGARNATQSLAIASRSRIHGDRETRLAWLSLDFLVDFNDRKSSLELVAKDDREFLWFIRNRIARELNDPELRLSIVQRTFIVEQFSNAWPRTASPAGAWHGNENAWDASEFIERIIYGLGGEFDAEATVALEQMTISAHSSYTSTLRHALAIQRRGRRDNEYTPTTLSQLRAIVANGLPESIDDMRAYFGERVLDLDARMRGSNTDMWDAYWANGKPRSENFCRNRLIDHISGQLPQGIRFEPEMHMPGQRRADIAAIRNQIGLPVEIKGQWHAKVWTAPTEQLAARYIRDWHAKGRGAYIVLWFGDTPDKNLPPHPEGLARPQTPIELHTMLVDRLPENLRDVIDVYVVDVSPLPTRTKKRPRALTSSQNGKTGRFRLRKVKQ